MCVGGLFGGGRRQQPAAPQRQQVAPTMKAAAPPAEMVTPEKIKDEQGDEDKLSTKKKKALEIKKVKEGVKKCEVYLVDFKPKLDEFFKDKDYYDREELQKFMGVDENTLHDILKWTARLTLGKRIEKCIEKTGKCNFEAEQ